MRGWKGIWWVWTVPLLYVQVTLRECSYCSYHGVVWRSSTSDARRSGSS